MARRLRCGRAWSVPVRVACHTRFSPRLSSDHTAHDGSSAASPPHPGRRGAAKRVPPTQRDDKHAQHGRLLRSVVAAPSPLERLLATARLALALLTDVLRRGEGAEDCPLLILGQHYLSHRLLGEEAGRVHVQEIATFDEAEGPKGWAGLEGAPEALLTVRLHPVAVAKAKRLGRELSIKVLLQPGAASAGSSLQLLASGEDYAISWPSLVLLSPLSAACPLALKGEMAISCPASGLFMTLAFDKDHSVKGTIEQLQPAAPAAKPQALGSVSGSWTSRVSVAVPKLGLEGVLFDAADISPAPVPLVDLRHIGPVRLPRLWSAIHDAVLYADPRAATGGRAAAKLAGTMASYLAALTLGGATRDAGEPAGAAGGPGGAAAAAAASSAPRSARSLAASSAALSTASGSDADAEEFDRQVEGLTSGRLEAAEDRRAVPPCYKEQHAAGRALRWTLHYALAS